MNEIRIDKAFNPQSHAAEANMYPRGVAEIRQRVAGAAGAGAVADGVNGLLRGASDLFNVIEQTRKESARAADEVELTRLNNFAREQVLRLDGIDNERTLEERTQGFREAFSQMIADSRNLSDNGRRQANLMLEKSAGAYRLKGVEQINRYWKNQQTTQAANLLDQAVAAGDVETALRWYDRTLELGVTPKVSRETVESMTFRNNLVNGYLSKLGIGALREEQKKLDELNPDGSFREFPMIKAPEAAELQGWIRNRINIKTNAGQDTLDEMTARGTLTSEALRELHEQGEISNAQWRAGLARIEKNRQATEQIISAARKERIQQTSNRISREMFEAYDGVGSGTSPERIAAFKARFNEEITKAEKAKTLDDSQITALKKTLKGYCDDLGRADGGIKSSDNYQAGLRYIEQLKLEGKLLPNSAASGGWLWKKRKEAVPGAAAFVEDSLKRALYDVCKAKPLASPEEIQTFLVSSAVEFQRAEVGKLAEKAFYVGNYAKSEDNVLVPLRVVRYGTVDGIKVAEYSDGTIKPVD